MTACMILRELNSKEIAYRSAPWEQHSSKLLVLMNSRIPATIFDSSLSRIRWEILVRDEETMNASWAQTDDRWVQHLGWLGCFDDFSLSHFESFLVWKQRAADCGAPFLHFWPSCHAFMALQHGMAKGALPFTALQAARSILMSAETSPPFLAGKLCRLCLLYSVDVYHQIIFWCQRLSQDGSMPW